MAFDDEAARAAQKWAEKLSSTNTMVHCSGDECGGCGENLAMHSVVEKISGTTAATDMWYNEVNDPGYDFSDPGFKGGTGHFTQVVWKGSTKLGCGVAGMYAVCRYCEKAGNWMGEFPKNVFPKNENCKGSGGSGGAAPTTPGKDDPSKLGCDAPEVVVPEAAGYNAAFNKLQLQ